MFRFGWCGGVTNNQNLSHLIRSIPSQARDRQNLQKLNLLKAEGGLLQVVDELSKAGRGVGIFSLMERNGAGG